MKKPYPSETAERFIVRLPDGMREQIKKAAKAHGRSMNAEIVYRIEESLSRDRWLNDMMESVSEEADTEHAGAESALIVAPEGMGEEQFMAIINGAFNAARLKALETIASRFRKVDGKYVPFEIEGDDSTKE